MITTATTAESVEGGAAVVAAALKVVMAACVAALRSFTGVAEVEGGVTEGNMVELDAFTGDTGAKIPRRRAARVGF